MSFQAINLTNYNTDSLLYSRLMTNQNAQNYHHFRHVYPQSTL